MNLSKKDKLWYAFIAIAVILPCIPGVIGGSFFGPVAPLVLLYPPVAHALHSLRVSAGHGPF